MFVGYGKTILFGEHFVVHGIPAIASAISLKTTATVKAGGGKGFNLIDDRLSTPGYKEKKKEHQIQSLKYIFKEFNFDPEKQPIEIKLGGDLKVMSGIGGSAASCVAIARALADFLGQDLSEERINEIAFEGEKGYHGTPSGLDNTASTYGSLIWFKKGSPNVMERISLEKPVEIVIGNTGLVANTKKAVAGVAERKEKEHDKYLRLFAQAEHLVGEARKALERFDLKEVGRLMNENHALLQDIEVSCDELDQLVKVARDNGAFGAKMTGGGLGGCMLALTPGAELQEKVAKAIEGQGFEVLRAKIGMK